MKYIHSSFDGLPKNVYKRYITDKSDFFYFEIKHLIDRVHHGYSNNKTFYTILCSEYVIFFFNNFGVNTHYKLKRSRKHFSVIARQLKTLNNDI